MGFLKLLVRLIIVEHGVVLMWLVDYRESKSRSLRHQKEIILLGNVVEKYRFLNYT